MVTNDCTITPVCQIEVMDGQPVVSVDHECVASQRGRRIRSHDLGEVWLMPWFDIVDEGIEPKYVEITHCPFCGDKLERVSF